MITVKTPKGEFFQANLRPRQGMTVEMALPPKARPGEEWTCFVDSSFLRLKCIRTTENTQVYEFEQIFDLKKWNRRHSTHLGEVVFRWDGAARPGSHTRRLMVVCPGDSDESTKTLVVINPVGQNVRIYPHQTLEVVLTSEVYNQPSFNVRMDNDHKGQPDRFLELQQTDRRNASYTAIEDRYTIVQGNVKDIPRTTSALDYCPNYPKEEQTRKSFTGPYRATHYEFSLTPAAIGQVQRMKNGGYPSCTVSFKEAASNGVEYAVAIEVMVRGNKKKHLPVVDKSVRTARYEPVIDARRILERERVVSASGLLLACPDLEDTWEFTEGQPNSLTVDLPPPNAYYTGAGEHERWAATVDPVYVFGTEHKSTTRLKCIPLEDRRYEDQIIQRYRIEQVEKEVLPPHVRMRTLGQIHFRPSGGSGTRRTIYFYLVSSPRTNQSSRPDTPKTTYRYTPPTPTHTAVNIEEIKTPGLMAGGRMTPFSEVKGDTCAVRKKKHDSTTLLVLPP